MIIRYTRRAVADLAEIRAFVAQDRPDAAAMVGQSIRGAVSHLARFPEAGRSGRVAGTRELIVPRLSFVIAYRVSTDRVEVLAILHAARRWPSSF